MEADASVVVEFVDYDVEEHTRAYWHKKKAHDYDDCQDEDYCDDYDECDCDEGCDGGCYHKHKTLKKHKFKTHCKPHTPCHCTRRFNVSVVLGITVKVMTDREVILNPPQGLPYKPKG